MFNSIKLVFIVEIPNFSKFNNLQILEQVLLLLNNKFKYFSTSISKTLGKNTAYTIKESPFHYPVAKKILSKSRRLVTINKEIVPYTIKNKPNCFIKPNVGFTIIKYLLNTLTLNTNSLFTIKSTNIIINLNYKPDLNK